MAIAGDRLLAGRMEPLWQHRAPIVRTALYLFGGYLLLMISLAGFAHYRYGSIGAAVASFRNERLSVYPATVDVGVGAPGETREATVELTNRTDEPIRLIGGTADCSCTVLGDIPVTRASAHSWVIWTDWRDRRPRNISLIVRPFRLRTWRGSPRLGRHPQIKDVSHDEARRRRHHRLSL
jgi:hypothetical protein